MNIDLSFTKDPEWMEQREVLWELWREEIKSLSNKKELDEYRHYFMTGEALPNVDMSDEALFNSFPLQKTDGWDYVLQHLAKNRDDFKRLFTETLQDRSSHKLFPHRAPYELARWDYFLGETFVPTIISRVPIASEKVTLELDPYDVFCRIAPSFTGFLQKGSGGDWPKWIQRADYFWSLWPLITNACFSAEEDSKMADSVYFATKLMEQIIKLKIRKEYDDPNQTRPKFLKMMEAKLDELYPQLCPKLQLLWDQAKAKKSAIN
jgi:hypothetical protein